MLRVGLVGIGFMGWIHYLAYRRAKGVKLAAVCSRDARKLAGDWRGIRGNFGPPGEQVDLSKLTKHRALAELLKDPEIDLVDLCLPPDLHCAAAVAALEAGKHVFCEKPIALTVAQADRMLAAARNSGKQLFIAHVLPFLPEYQFAWRAIQSERFGRPLGARFKRIISDPHWLPDFFDPRKVGGPLVDLHIHDAHFIRLAFGQPASVTSRGRWRGAVVEFVETQFGFADPSLIVSAASGVLQQQGRAFTHAFEIYLERATLLFDFAVLEGQPVTLMPLTVLNEKGKAARPKLPAADPVDGFVSEIAEVAQAVKAGRPSALLDGSLARDALALCHQQTESVRRGKTVRV
ncbi:MAG TPA: Gfo/Idh/MocA family oxidoreductase [Pirellulales bacterium]|jgi:predicted dehydrogenase|nr:Gfo/Idh/MocA family oxidoreductase [Pirellulales bacterium]